MTPDDVVARARSMIGRFTIYELGKGGMSPTAPVAYNVARECDCSGFVAWCLGESRHTDFPWYRKLNGGWFETTAIFRDCADPYGAFDGLEWLKGQPGDLLVWGDRRDGAGKLHQGHVGVISAVDETGPTHVVHCSLGNYRASGGLDVPLSPRADAVAETAVLIFRQHEARVARFCLVDHTEVAA